jgi:hypothetical protein
MKYALVVDGKIVRTDDFGLPPPELAGKAGWQWLPVAEDIEPAFDAATEKVEVAAAALDPDGDRVVVAKTVIAKTADELVGDCQSTLTFTERAAGGQLAWALFDLLVALGDVAAANLPAALQQTAQDRAALKAKLAELSKSETVAALGAKT